MRAVHFLTGSAALCAALAIAQVAAGQTPLSKNDGKGPFLFSYFLGNGDGLHLAISSDGRAFTPLHDNKPYLVPKVGGKLMRDPCLRQGPDGVFHLVWTSGWWDRGIGVASSKDLVNWSDQQFVEVMKNEPTAVNCWAPELFYDAKAGDWMIFWATTIPGRYPMPVTAGADKAQNGTPLNHRLYYVTTKDFKTYSDTKLLYDPGFNCIDATITAHDGKYIMVFKDETKVPAPKKNLRMATADNPEGPWSAASPPISIDWVEGPTICKVGDGWDIYYDEYTRHKYGAIRTTDWKHFQTVSDKLSFPKGSRHGTVIPIAPETAASLEAAK